MLPDDYYAMTEQFAGGFGHDVLTLQGSSGKGTSPDGSVCDTPNRGGVLHEPPQVALTDEYELEFYRRKQQIVSVRHIRDDGVVAIVEVVSSGNKSSRNALRAFVEKAVTLLEKQIHLLVLDLQPPTRRDPRGIHDCIWYELTGKHYSPPKKKNRTLASYEAGPSLKAYVQPTAVGDELIDMPLFLEPGAHVSLPLEEIYNQSFSVLGRRWQKEMTRHRSNESEAKKRMQ